MYMYMFIDSNVYSIKEEEEEAQNESGKNNTSTGSKKGFDDEYGN